MEGVRAEVLPRADERHPDGQYSALAKLFHWVTVVLLAIALPVGVVIKYISDKDDGVYKMAFYAIHESAGVTIFVVAVLRLLWRWISPPPPYPAHIPAVMRGTATMVHFMLYVALIVQPLLGFFATNAFGFPLQGQTAYLGLIDFPKFMEANTGLAEPLQQAHTVLGYAIVGLLAAHIAGAVFHHALRRDGTLLRML